MTLEWRFGFSFSLSGFRQSYLGHSILPIVISPRDGMPIESTILPIYGEHCQALLLRLYWILPCGQWCWMPFNSFIRYARDLESSNECMKSAVSMLDRAEQ